VSALGHAKRHRIRMLVPLWGAGYYEKWLGLPAASLLADGNILHLNECSDFELVFLCKSQDLAFLQHNESVRQLSAQVRIKTVTIDEFFPVGQSVSYGVPLTLAYAKGIEDLGEDGLGTFVILLNADFVLSTGSLAALLTRLDEGYHIVTAPSLRVVDHEARPLLEFRLRKDGAAVCFSAREMMAIAERHLHQTVLTRTINCSQPIEAWYYHLVYWRLNPTCLAARYFLLMPLCFQVRRQMPTVVCPVDYAFIQEICPGGCYTALTDSDDLLMIELQARDSEAGLLEFASRFANADDALDYRVSKIVANAAEWTTAEHRRAFSYTLLFHSQDLPTDAAAGLEEFNRHIVRVEEQLPTPVPAIRHFHWLGAIHAYRSAMYAGDPFCHYPDAILDEANRIYFEPFEVDAELAETEPLTWPPPHDGWVYPAALRDAVGAASLVVTLDGMVGEVRQLNRTAKILSVKLDQLHNFDRGMTVLLPSSTVTEGTVLCIHVLTDTIANWPKLAPMCDAALTSGASVIVVFRESTWTSFGMRQPGREWILSLFSQFFSNKYAAHIEPIPTDFPSAMSEFSLCPTQPLAEDVSCYGFIVTITEMAPDFGPVD
jgi:hypothetical protein